MTELPGKKRLVVDITLLPEDIKQIVYEMAKDHAYFGQNTVIDLDYFVEDACDPDEETNKNSRMFIEYLEKHYKQKDIVDGLLLVWW